MTDKLVVHYRAVAPNLPLEVNYRYALYPVDHPSPFVSNTCICYTSKVVDFDIETGIIETLNTIYTPLDSDALSDFKKNVKNKTSTT